MYAISFPAGKPTKPGLVRVLSGGSAFPVEIWKIPVAKVGALVRLIPDPLAVGSVWLDDGSSVHGFICEGYVADREQGVEDISHLGSWKAFLTRQESKG